MNMIEQTRKTVSLLAGLVALTLAGTAGAAIVTPPPLDIDAPTGGFPPPTPTPVPGCPVTNIGIPLPGLCIIDNVSAGVEPNSPDTYESVRIGRTPDTLSSLSIGKGASLTVQANPTTFLGSRSVIVGDNFGTAAHLDVRGNLTIVEPENGNGSGGLLVGFFAAPANPQVVGYPLGAPTTTLSISRGGVVDVQKPGGFGTAAAVGVGFGVGSNSALVLDGGINGFGSAAEGATLTTNGNLSIGRQGTGAVNLFREADVTAQLVYMSTISSTGASSLSIGFNSTLSGTVIAGIGLDPTGHPDISNTAAHGTANIFVARFGTLNGSVTLGDGGTLGGYGTITGSVANFGGRVLPGNSPGTLTIQGDYEQNGGSIVIEIASDTVFDVLDVGGHVNIRNADIIFSFIDGFAPSAGFSFDFVKAGIDLALSDIRYSFVGLKPGFAFDVNANGNALVFTARNDGVSVPEPGSLSLFAAALALAGRRRRRV